SDGNDVALFDTENGKELRRYKGPRNLVKHVAVSPDGKYVAASADNHNVTFVWDFATAKDLDTRDGHHGGFVGQVTYSADGKTITTVSGDATVRQWDAATGKQQRSLEVRQANNRAADVSPDGKLLAVGNWPGEVWMVNTATGKGERHWK